MSMHLTSKGFVPVCARRGWCMAQLGVQLMVCCKAWRKTCGIAVLVLTRQVLSTGHVDQLIKQPVKGRKVLGRMRLGNAVLRAVHAQHVNASDSRGVPDSVL